MAIFKAINSKGTSAHGALRNCLQYVMQPSKTDNETLCFMLGPVREGPMDYNSVYGSFLETKAEWGKDSGRMYMHYTLSFPKEDNISPEQALDFGIQFAEQTFYGYQSLIAVHTDKEHVHCHFVVNTVSYIDGKKLQKSRKDLKADKELCNRMCADYGLSVAQKGKHADGTDMEKGTVTAWNKDKYNAIINSKKPSYLVNCGIAVLKALEQSSTKEGFILAMESQGWQVDWREDRKNIVFTDESGKRVRDNNLEKSFHIIIGKENKKNEINRLNKRLPSRKKRGGKHI